jgi:hypothetical protein
MTTTTTTLDHRFNRDPEIHDGMVGVCELCGQQQFQDAARVCPVAVKAATWETRYQYLRRLNPYELASIADIATPSSKSSPGAEFMESVQSVMMDYLSSELEQVPINEAADASLNVYTHDIWLQFVDLCAYNEDISGITSESQSMTERAMLSLYLIAERLIDTLCTMLNFTTDRD